MKKFILTALYLSMILLSGSSQDNASYIKAHAILIDDPQKLSDSIYTLLSPYHIIMFGEMHGTNESAPFVNGLANLFTSKGDSVLVGLEIPSTAMNQFNKDHTDSSIYQSSFFQDPPLSGRESFAWAELISSLNKNAQVKLFFFDLNENDGLLYQRDSLMYTKIKAQFKQHPKWKMVTLSGNYHNRISGDPTMTFYLKTDKELNLSSKICSLNMEYLEGRCRANFGRGLEVKLLGQPPRSYDTALNYEKYIVLVSPKTYYEYNGFYYTKYITAAKMTSSK